MKYGAANGVYALFFFSAVVTDRIPQGDAFVLSLWGEWHLCTLPVGRVTPLYSPFRESASIADGWSPAKPPPAAAARRAEALHPLLETEYDMKNKKMSIRISEQDLAAIHRKANTANLSVTDYVTRSCLNKQIVVVDGLENIIREQKAIGKNLNRLTLLCNMGRVSVADLSEVKNEYARLNEFLCSLLDRRRWQ